MKKSLIFIFSVLFFISTTPAIAKAAELSEIEKVAFELLETSGATKMLPIVTEKLINQQKKSMPDIPEAFWKAFSSEVDPEALSRKLTSVYAQHFTIDEMKAIIVFHKSVTGEKYVSALPKIAVESRNAFKQWAMELRILITKKLEKTDLKKMRESSKTP